MTDVQAPTLELEFCDEWTRIESPGPFTIGRDSNLSVDDNPYLHRVFLSLEWDRYWWLRNVGSRLTATINDGEGTMNAWLAPAATLPILFRRTEVRFTAGATNYCLAIHLGEAPLVTSGTTMHLDGSTTLRPIALSDNQRRCVLALAEPALNRSATTTSRIPTSAEAADRLGWTLSAFNRQLDTVCQKLTDGGVRGLHGGTERLATGRRARLVEYALAVRLVTPTDLALLP